MATAKPKRWPIALLVGFVTALASTVAVVPIGDWGMRMHHVSNMEGGRGCMMIVIWMPLAAIGGFVVGLIVSLTIGGAGFVGFLKRQGIALFIAAVLLAIGAWMSYATADHPPLIDDKDLALEIEVQVPAKGRTIEELKAQDFSVALVVTNTDRSYSDMRWAEAVQSNESITVKAWATLNSRNAGREITAGMRDENRQIFTVVLPSSPRKIEEQWSQWTPPRERFDGSKPSAEDQYLVRYRVRFAEEYSPTPRPSEESPTPEETQPKESASPAIR